MTRTAAIAERVLEHVGDEAEAEVVVTAGTDGLTRFANSFIHQNVAEEGVSIRLRVAVDQRVGSATMTGADDGVVGRFVERAIATAALQPVDHDWPGLATSGDVTIPGHEDEATKSCGPGERAELVKAFIDAGQGLNAAGYCQTIANEVAFANSAGHVAGASYTQATLDGIHRTSTSAGSGHATSARIADIDAAAVGGLAARRARDGEGGYDVKPGEYEVVLAPECVATIAVFLAGYGFNAKAHIEGQSFARLGDQQFDEKLHLVDDAGRLGAVGFGFDVEGTPKGQVHLVSSGVTSGLAHDRRTAAKAGERSTGHAVPGGEVFGPFPLNVFVEGGAASVDDMIASVDRGLYVATFNYCRVLDPKTLAVTGLTRNGTFMIENGVITGAVTNMRFTQSFVAALGPGRLLGLGDDGRLADSEFGPAVIHAPSLRLASWHFTGGAAG